MALAAEHDQTPPTEVVTAETFVRKFGRRLAEAGHQPLEGRLVAQLMLSPDPLTLFAASKALFVTKGGLSKLVSEMLARGDLEVTREVSSREHHLRLTDGTYLRDLLELRALSLDFAMLGYALLRDTPDLPETVARRVRDFADLRARTALHLSYIIEHREEAQQRARSVHLTENWDAVPPRTAE